jgi:geranylgeranyl pyrophosphate synthase
MNEYKDEAIAILDTFEQNDAARALRKLIDYTISRDV